MVSGCVAHRLARARNCLQGDGPSYARRSHMGRELVVAVCVLNRQIGQRYTVVSAVLQAGKAKDATLLQLLQCIHFYIAILQFSHTAEHIKGKRNTTADNLTARNKLSQILQAASRRHGAVAPGVSGTAGLDRSSAMDGTVQKLFDIGVGRCK